MKLGRFCVKRLVCLVAIMIASSFGAQAAAATVTYVYTDPQGTVLSEADQSGNVIAQYDYRPYGSAYSGGGMASPQSGLGYTSHVNDPDTGLVYMQARYYDPAIGRFLSIDPSGIGDGEFFSFSPYAYANNNPVVNVDPDGRCTGSNVKDRSGNCADSGMSVVSSAGATGGVRLHSANPSVTKYFSHSSIDMSGHITPSAFPKQTQEALGDILDSPQGRAVANTIRQSGEKISLLLLPESAKPRFQWDAEDGGILYSLNVSGFIANNNTHGELTGATMGLLLMHEIGHTPAASRTFGYPYSPHLNWQNEFDVIRRVENPYRAYKGMDARKTYGGKTIPGGP